MMPQDSGPSAWYSLSIALRDHSFEEVPTIEPTGRFIWIYTILEKKFKTEVRPKMRTIDRSPVWDHLHRNTMHRLHQANCRVL